jgi:hypothetical protein
VLLTGFAVVKAYAVANFSLTTGAALLTAAPISVLLGSLMSYAYWIFPLVSLAALWHGFRLWQAERWSAQTTALLGVGLFTALLSPWPHLAWSSAAFVVFIAVFHLPTIVDQHRARKQLPRRAWPASWARLSRMTVFSTHLFFVVAIAWVVLASLTRPWTPIEIIKVTDAGQQRLIVGNVLSAEGEWTTVMRAGDRGLSRIRSDDVLTRRLCHLTGAQSPGQGPLLWTIVGREYRSPNRSCTALVEEEPSVPPVAGSLPG